MYLNPHIIINRKYLKHSTVGFACAGDDLEIYFYTLELPWRNNNQNVSCIPEGEYWVFKRRDKQVFQFEAVPVRTYIQIHCGNFTNQIQGCLLPGDAIKHLNNDGIQDVCNSEKIMKALWNALPDRFLVRIESVDYNEATNDE